MLCVPIRYGDKIALQKANQKADLIELNCSHLSLKHAEELRSHCHKPVIFKLDKFDLNFLYLSPNYVDLPHTLHPALFTELGQRFPQIKRICSFHHFKRTDELEEIYHNMRMCPAEIYKLATYANSTLDALRMLQLVKEYQCIGICMGKYGTLTRILARVFGAPWTYAPLTMHHKTAPGQLLFDELETIYYFRKHNSETALYALLGDPVHKSAGHFIHNFAFNKLKLNAVYVKMNVKKAELPLCLSLCHALGFKGLSITMPLKTMVSSYLDYPHSTVINTVKFSEQRSYGWNTDGSGALDAVEKKVKVKGKHIVLLGAGGAAYGIAFEARKRGALLTILNRTFSHAERLAHQVGGLAASLSDFSQVAKKGYDILINCTSVGMNEEKNALLIDPKDLLPNRIVMEIISHPSMTPLLIAAQQKDCLIIKGMEMFIQQAVGQYRHWFKSILNEKMYD